MNILYIDSVIIVDVLVLCDLMVQIVVKLKFMYFDVMVIYCDLNIGVLIIDIVWFQVICQMFEMFLDV